MKDEKSINALLEANYQKGIADGMVKAFAMLGIIGGQDAKEGISDTEDRRDGEANYSEQERED